MQQTENHKQRRKSSVDIGNMVFGKVPPQAKEVEEVILGAILLHKEAFDEVTGIIRPESFYVEAHQRIYKAMQSLAIKSQPIDLMTVVEELKKREDLEFIGGPYYVSKLTNNVSSGANIISHARLIQEKFIKRELIRIAGEIIGEGYEDSTDVFEFMESAEKRIMEVGTANIDGGMLSIDNVLTKAINKIEDWRKNDSTLTGIPTGFMALDRATRGWQPGDLILIAARPSVGKTALALNLIRNAALGEKKTTVAVWSLEMKAVYLVLRMLAAESDIILHKIQTGRLNDEEMKIILKKGVDKLLKANIFFDESSNVTIRSLKSKARRLKKKNNLGMIVVDYIQLMSTEEKKGNREQEIANISRELKNLAQELEVPVIALSQISREGEKGVTWENGPKPSGMRESGSLEQDADVIVMLWGPTEAEVAEDPDLDGKRKIRIAKQRNGVLLTIPLDFKNEIQLFSSIDKQLVGPSEPGNWRKVTPEEKDDDLPF